MQSSQDNDRTPLAIPSRKFERAVRKGEMDGNADDLREGMARRMSLKQILVPVIDGPVLRRARGNARQSERRGQHVLAKAGMRVLWIEGIEQEGVMRDYSIGSECNVESRSFAHSPGNIGFSH